MTKLYTNTAVENLAKQYLAKGGCIKKYKDSVLLEYGLAVFTGKGLKTCVIKDIFINSWSSAYSVRFYSKMPKKFLALTPIN